MNATPRSHNLTNFKKRPRDEKRPTNKFNNGKNQLAAFYPWVTKIRMLKKTELVITSLLRTSSGEHTRRASFSWNKA